MFYLPSARRLLAPLLLLTSFIVLYRSFSPHSTLKLPTWRFHASGNDSRTIHIPISQIPTLGSLNASENHLSPLPELFFEYDDKRNKAAKNVLPDLFDPVLDPILQPLFQCRRLVNKYTSHIRLPYILQNLSQVPPGSKVPERRVFWNPTIIALPYWSKNQYLVVSRIVTDGNHQENVLCEANVCRAPGPNESRRGGEDECTSEDLEVLGPAGGMRCAHAPVLLSVPPTPAENCEGIFASYADIPGFHDPRIFWSGRGEPLMMVNTQSRYACFGLWMIDLREPYAPLEKLLSSSPTHFSIGGPLKSYSTLTELTRNPANTRAAIEKNWFLFYSDDGKSYVHYDLPFVNGSTHGRTFAMLLGNGLTTHNLTDPLELPCLHEEHEMGDPPTKHGHWHQATNALRLILCHRSDAECQASEENQVFFALVHRKLKNELGLPMRYERYFMVWSATPPFRMLGITLHPILMANESALPFAASEAWDDDEMNRHVVKEHKLKYGANSFEPFGGKPHWADFTYTVSLAYAWGRPPRDTQARGDESEDMHVGYMDDEVLLAIGVDDRGQVFTRVPAEELLSCLRACLGSPHQRQQRRPHRSAVTSTDASTEDAGEE